MSANEMRKSLKRLAGLTAKAVRSSEVIVYESHALGNVVCTKSEKIRRLFAIGFDCVNGAHNNILNIG